MTVLVERDRNRVRARICRINDITAWIGQSEELICYASPETEGVGRH